MTLDKNQEPRGQSPLSRSTGDVSNVRTHDASDLEAVMMNDGSPTKMSETPVSIDELIKGAGGKGEG